MIKRILLNDKNIAHYKFIINHKNFNILFKFSSKLNKAKNVLQIITFKFKFKIP